MLSWSVSISPQGFAAHVSPFTEIRDIGGLLSQCGFTMLTIVSCHEILVISSDSP